MQDYRFGGMQQAGAGFDDAVTLLKAIATNLSSQTTALTGFLGVSGTGGNFTLGAAASTVVAQTLVTASSLIFLQPTNAAAATLMAGSSSLYISAKSAGVSFTVATADAGSAAGTETFSYLLVNLT